MTGRVAVRSEFFQHRGEEQRHHDLHVAGEIVTLAALHSWARNHVGERAVVLEKIQIDRGQILHRMAKVARQTYALEEYFGQHDR